MMSERIETAMKALREYMFQNVYFNPKAKGEEVRAESMIRQLFWHYYENAKELPEEYLQMIQEGEKTEVVVCDYIAGMTDTYAVKKFTEFFIPESWKN